MLFSPSMTLLRSSELLLIAYFLYASLLAILLPVSQPVAVVTVAVNGAVIGGHLLLALVDSCRPGRFLGILRDWYPAPLMLLAYREMGWFAQPHAGAALENSWVIWDRVLLNDWGMRAAIESLGPLVPGILEISYSLVYTIAPFSLAVLYVHHRREKVNAFLFAFLLGILLVYALFPYFPSEPPWTVFPGEDFPGVETVFRRFNGGLLRGYGIHTSVFPSAHVSGAFSAAFAMIRLLPEGKWVGRLLLVLAILIATATVYGRYHYAVDAVAGFGIAVVTAAISRRFVS